MSDRPTIEIPYESIRQVAAEWRRLQGLPPIDEPEPGCTACGIPADQYHADGCEKACDECHQTLRPQVGEPCGVDTTGLLCLGCWERWCNGSFEDAAEYAAERRAS